MFGMMSLCLIGLFRAEAVLIAEGNFHMSADYPCTNSCSYNLAPTTLAPTLANSFNTAPLCSKPHWRSQLLLLQLWRPTTLAPTTVAPTTISPTTVSQQLYLRLSTDDSWPTTLARRHLLQLPFSRVYVSELNSFINEEICLNSPINGYRSQLLYGRVKMDTFSSATQLN